MSNSRKVLQEGWYKLGLINLKPFQFLKKESDDTKVLLVYRFLTLIGTNVFYLIGYQKHSLLNKLTVVSCITIAAIILMHLYKVNKNNSNKIIILVFIETLGNCFILIPSGGLNSPYVWYALNTVIIASIVLGGVVSWINLLVYIVGSASISYYIFDRSNLTIINYIYKESNLILSFILITFAIRLLSIVLKKVQKERNMLEITNSKLLDANRKNKEAIEYIMDLYHAVHILSNQNDIEQIIKLVLQYTKKITKSKLALFIKSEDNNIIVDQETQLTELEIKMLQQEVYNNMDYLLSQKEPLEIEINDEKILIIGIKLSNKLYGVFAIKVEYVQYDLLYQNCVEELLFLAELSSIAIERIYLERVNERLIKSDEQNRIANEIHDSALQRLFSMSCGIYNLMNNIDSSSKNVIKGELNLIRKTANNVMKELRTSIYGMSFKKNGVSSFYNDIKNYINDVIALNNIDIKFEYNNSYDYLILETKRALYRIICEGISNAIRHGNASKIEVLLEFNSKNNQLKIIDNGSGFNMEKINLSETGLGLTNIHHLVNTFRGNVSINSQKGRGTALTITIPNSYYSNKEELYESTIS